MNEKGAFFRPRLRDQNSSQVNNRLHREGSTCVPDPNSSTIVTIRREIITVRGQSYVWRLPKYWSLTPSPTGECVPPRLWCGRRTHSLGGEGGRRQTQLCTLHMYVLCVTTILIICCYWCSAAMGKLPIPLAGHCVVTVTWNGRNAALGISSVYLIKLNFRRSSAIKTESF